MRLLAALALILGLGACGLRPLYSGGTNGVAARSLANIEVAPIPGQAGWLVRNAINDRLAPMRGADDAAGAVQYRLVVELDDQITGFGVRADDAITRERRTLRARYQLVDAARGTVLLDATAGSDAGIDVVSSEYATIAAENSALERLADVVANQIVSRIATADGATQDPAAAGS